MWNRETYKAAERLRELATDPVASAYLVGVLLESRPPAEYPDLVEAALVFTERFGASGNDHRKGCVQATEHVVRCARCTEDLVRVLAQLVLEDRMRN